jgi:hypothetical protein
MTPLARPGSGQIEARLGQHIPSAEALDESGVHDLPGDDEGHLVRSQSIGAEVGLNQGRRK